MAASCGSHDQKLLKSGRTKPEGPPPPHPMRRYSLNRSYCKSWVYAPVFEIALIFYKIAIRKSRRRFITAERAPHLSSVILSGAKRSRRILAPHPRRGRRPRRPVQNAPIIMPTPGESAPRPRRGGYHPPAQRVPNPHAALRRIRSAFRVGGDDPGAPLADTCRNPARCGHRALQGAASHRRGRRPRRRSWKRVQTPGDLFLLAYKTAAVYWARNPDELGVFCDEHILESRNY